VDSDFCGASIFGTVIISGASVGSTMGPLVIEVGDPEIGHDVRNFLEDPFIA
jgi:acyl dehydratase